MKKIVIIVLYWVMYQNLCAQNLKLQKSLATHPAMTISLDKKQSFFLADARGNIYKYDSTGKEQLNFSPTKLADITLLEAWQTMRVFVFYRDLQEFLLLDRFLNPVAQYPINQEVIGFAHLSTLSADNSIWVLDNRDFSLKKYDPKNDILLVHTSLDLILNSQNYEINFMREYQNLLIINDKISGILIFDNLGNYKKTLPYTQLNYLSILEDEICFLQNNELIFFDLYKLTERKVVLPATEKWRFALQLGNYVVTVGENKIYYWR